MTRPQRIVVLCFSLVLAIALFLLEGPFSDNYGTGPDGGVAINQWNPIRSGREEPLLGIIAPIALIGLGLFVYFGKRKD